MTEAAKCPNRIQSKKNRLLHLDLLRIVAVLAVIFNHTMGQTYSESVFNHDGWIVKIIFFSLTRWSVPVFIMISGALFLDSSKAISIKKIFCKYIRNVIFAFVIWSIVYALFIVHRMTNFQEFIYTVIQGPYHFWFLKMLIGLYIVIPILKLIVANREMEIYFLFLSFITASLIPVIFHFFNPEENRLSELFYNWIKMLDLDIALGFTGYFVLGHFLSSIKIKPFAFRLLYFLSMLSILAAIILTVVEVQKIELWSEFWLDFLNPLTIFISISIFILFLNFKKRIEDKYRKIIVNMAKMSLGVYIVHLIVLWRLNTFFNLNASTFNPVWWVPLLSIIVFLISYGLVSIINRIPYLRVLVDWSRINFGRT